jgi:hypothetical protein
MKNEFTTFDIIRLFNINRNQLQPWIDGHFITPSIQKATRRGEKNLFSVDDLYRIRLFQYLLFAGFSRRDASQYGNISFENVGENPGQIGYGVFWEKAIQRSDNRLAATGCSPELRPGKPMNVKMPEGALWMLVVNLFEIKKAVDSLLE